MTDLIKDARAVLADLAPIRREVRQRDGRWYEVRMRPYRTTENSIDGIVITFVGCFRLSASQEALRESDRQLRQQKRLVDMSRDPIFVWDYDSGIRGMESRRRGTLRLQCGEAIGRRKEDLLGTAVPDSSFAALKAKLLQDGSWSGEVRQRTKDGRQLIIESQLQLESFDGRRLVLENADDVTEHRPGNSGSAC